MKELKYIVQETIKNFINEGKDSGSYEPESKDVERIKSLITKCGGDENEKSLQFANNMANSIDFPSKAHRRGQAAKKLGYSKVAKIFFEREKDLNNALNEIHTGEIGTPSNANRYEDIIYLQGETAREVIGILEEKGEEATLEYLQHNFYYPGEHNKREELGHGDADKVFKKDGFIMAYNLSIPYISLEFDTQNGSDIGECMDSKENGMKINESTKGEHNFRYLSLKTLQGGLEIKLNEEGNKEVKELMEAGKSSDDIFYELFEDVQGNSEYVYHSDMGESGFGLTNSPGITDGFHYEGKDTEGLYKTDYPKESDVYWFPDYMVKDPLEELVNNGEVIFTKAETGQDLDEIMGLSFSAEKRADRRNRFIGVDGHHSPQAPQSQATLKEHKVKKMNSTDFKKYVLSEAKKMLKH